MERPLRVVLTRAFLFGVGALLLAGPVGTGSSLAVDRPPADSLLSRPLPIAEVRRDQNGDAVPDRLGDTITVAGRVTAGRDELTAVVTNYVALQDSGGGLHALLPDGPSVERGDSLRIRGVLKHRYGLTQLKGLSYDIVEASRRVPPPMPLTVPAAADERYEGRLVRIQGRITTKSENEGGRYLLLADPNAETSPQVMVFIAHRHTSRVSLSEFAEGDRVQVTGILGQHDYSAPYVDYYQIQPRMQADLTQEVTASPYLWWALYGLGGGAVVATIALFVLRTTVRRRTRKLRDSQSRFRGIANSVPGVIFQLEATTDDAPEFRFVSDRAGEILEVSPDEGTFLERFSAQIPDSHRDELHASIRSAIDEKKALRFEFPFKGPDDTQSWLLGAATPEQRDDKLLYNGVFLDITDRKQAEAKARLQTKVLRQITEGRPLQDVLAELVEELEAQRPGMLGSVLLYDSSENRIKHGAAPSLPEDYNQAIDGVEVGPHTGSCGTAMHSGSPVIAEDIEADPRWENFREKALQHGLRACWSVPIRDPEGKIVGSFAMYYRTPKAPSDADWAVIEEARSLARIAIVRHQDTEQLRLLTEAVEQSTEAILITEGAPLDPPGPRIEYVNPAHEEMMGYRKEELLGRTPRIFQGPETDREVLASLRENLEAGEPWEGETVNYRRDGTPRRVWWSVAPVYDKDGAIQHWVSVQRDVTEERQREQALKDAKEAAEEAARLKSSMLANMSHEIRTPLTSIIGFAEVLGDDDPDGASTRDMAGLIEKSGRRLLQTLDSVLALSKLEAGQMELSEEPVDVETEMREVAEQFEGRADEANLEVHLDTPDGPVQALCDGGGLQIVLHNLVSNALKYSEEGGHVWLRAYPEDAWVVLEVEDTGIGMDEEEIEQLFEPFRQASEGIARKYEGTGLGLTVTQEAVDQMGGTIEVDTEPGEGTCFSVRLPSATAPAAESSDTKQVAADGDSA